MAENNFPELKNLLGLPLTKTTRLEQVQYFHFGKASVTNAHGLILDVGAWTLEVSCFWQLEQNGNPKIEFLEAEVPRDAKSFADAAFDVQMPGNSLRDRKLHELVKSHPKGLKVWQVTASEDGDLTISLDMKHVLRVQPSQGVLPEASFFWRLFSNVSEEAVGFGPEGVMRLMSPGSRDRA